MAARVDPSSVAPLNKQRTITAGMLKSLIHHKRAASSGKGLVAGRDGLGATVIATASPASASSSSSSTPGSHAGPPTPFLPADHPHARPLTELRSNGQSRAPQPIVDLSPRKDIIAGTENVPTGANLKAPRLAKQDLKAKDIRPPSPKKSKSSTTLANILTRPKSSKNLRKDAAESGTRDDTDKENQKLMAHVESHGASNPPPIYAQFAKVPLEQRRDLGSVVKHEIDLYTPQMYTPRKQRDFSMDPHAQPSLYRHEPSQRPKSTYIPSSISIQDMARRVSGSNRQSCDLTRRASDSKKQAREHDTPTEPAAGLAFTARGRRMMTALKSSSKAKLTETKVPSSVLHDKDVDTEFESMLDRRNIPENQRGRMRGLALSLKRDLVRQDWAEQAAARDRPMTKGSESSAEPTDGNGNEIPVKKRRPRSRTFTLSRSASKDPPASRKILPDTFLDASRKKSSESSRGTRSLTATSAAVAQSMIAKAKGQMPDDFVSYLRKVQKPEAVEVGKLHKLRLLLRNETVAWTDEFIKLGGMEEIVSLLRRIMQVEWREEHEDTLLHENLLCLKALSTTALALQHLDEIHGSLFPALLHMLFDEEKKGPSEFLTRNIITSILLTFIKAAPLVDRKAKAETVLGYLRNPEPCESDRPVGFVLDMRRARPYTLWNKEVVNVTKEVFWIFLHNLNVVPLPGASSDHSTDDDNAMPSGVDPCSIAGYNAANPHHVYMVKHFPKELPPVPAAPYVGGVEWDATNYLASHLDLINAIIACTPGQDERNALRSDVRMSGWEKTMGATMRTCKEKFYGSVHAGLRCWVAAAVEDGWDTRNVRCGPSSEASSPRKTMTKNPAAVTAAAAAQSPAKKRKTMQMAPEPSSAPPKIDMKLDFAAPAPAAVAVAREEGKTTAALAGQAGRDRWL